MLKKELFQQFIKHEIYLNSLVKQRVSSVDDLADQVASLQHSPELSPNLKILLEGSDLLRLMGLFEQSNLATPNQKRIFLMSVDFFSSHFSSPMRFTRNTEMFVFKLLNTKIYQFQMRVSNYMIKRHTLKPVGYGLILNPRGRHRVDEHDEPPHLFLPFQTLRHNPPELMSLNEIRALADHHRPCGLHFPVSPWHVVG